MSEQNMANSLAHFNYQVYLHVKGYAHAYNMHTMHT